MPAFALELDTVKAFLGYDVSGSPTDTSRDALLQIWLDASLQLAQQITGRNLLKATYRDTFGYHDRSMYLNEWPVESIISVSQGTSILLPSVHYQAFLAKGHLQFSNCYFYHHTYWQSGFNYLTVDYVGGYDTLPPTLLMAVLMGIQAAEQAHKQMTSFGGIVKQVSVIDVGSTAFSVKQNATTAAMLSAMTDHLEDFMQGFDNVGLGAHLLHETERIGDAPGSPG